MSVGVSGILDLVNGLQNQLEYWREYKGERIRIEQNSFLTGGRGSGPSEVVYLN